MSNPKKIGELKDSPKRKKLTYEISSGNVFADLGFENPEEALVKSDLIFKISQIIKRKKYTQKEAAKIIKVDQPRVSLLLRGRVDLFSVDMLIHFLNALGQDIQIVVKPKPRSHKKATTTVITSCISPVVPLAAKSY